MAVLGCGRKKVRWKVPLMELWVWRNVWIERQMTIFGDSYQRKGPGYVAQERERLLAEAEAYRKRLKQNVRQ